ncbi:MAG: alginate export family protein [Acidobacteria bacterium]|nr:alginate export family protein [Acidobacteriota bacterium]
MKQGFIRIRPNDSNSLRFGRFEFVDGTETTPPDETLAALKRDRIAHRLIGNFAWSHVGRSLDGGQYVYNKPKTNLTMTAGRPTRGVFQVDGWGDLDIGLASVALTKQLPLKKSAGEWRVFAIQYHDWRSVLKTDNRALPTRGNDRGNVRVTTFGGHYVHAFNTASAGKFDLLFWGALQTGRWGVLDHRAGSGVVEAGYQPPIRVLKPWFRAGYAYGSGDGDAGDGDHNTFFQILPTPRIYARLPFYNMMNNEDAFGEVTVRPHQKVSIKGAVHWLRLAKRNDLWYQGGGAYQPWTFGYAGRPSNGNRSLANVYDVGAEVQANANLAVGIYYADAEGKSVTSSIYPNGKHARLGYVELRYRR